MTATVSQVKYPSTSSVALTITLASLAADTAFLAGRQSSIVDNRTNLDLDHAVSGVITLGTGPAAGQIEVWAFAPRSEASGTLTWPQSVGASDAGLTMNSFFAKLAAFRSVVIINTDASANRAYDFAPVSLFSLFGYMPQAWGLFVVQSTGAALNATGANHAIQYERIQQTAT